MNDFLQFSDRLRLLPVIHGSIDFAIRVREELLSRPYDCIAVPLPASWAPDVSSAIERLPAVTAVVQQAGELSECSYVPIDPCQPVVAALRLARRERLAIEFIDLETQRFEPISLRLPDPYALKILPVEKFLAAVLPALPRPPTGSQADARARRMAFELHRLELDYKNILFLPSVADWPWIREAYFERREYPANETYFSPIQTHPVSERTLAFFLGELPFITALYEKARATLDPDEHLAIDGVKQLLLAARDRWSAARREEADWLGPKLLQVYLQYVRNLTLLGRRLSPDLYTLVVAAKQIGGDGFARILLECARDYPIEHPPIGAKPLRMGIGQAELPDLGVMAMRNRLPGIEVGWRTCPLLPEPRKQRKGKLRLGWNPLRQCSWPPEDVRIESFQMHVREQAKAILGQDLARTEKFTSSVKDGIDIRETLRQWHTGNLYVKEIPPSRGNLEIVVFLFEVPADPEKYTWKTTWQNEHAEESVISFFATDFMADMIGPGIGRARYGGVFFLFPPRDVADVWTDPRLPKIGGLEDRLLAGAILNSRERHIAVVSPGPLKSAWRALARSRGKKLVHLPLSRFSGRTIDRLRTMHVLNGREVRSYAAEFIQGE